MSRPEPAFAKLSDAELEAMVAACERRLLAGVSSHGDVISLVATESELLRRQRERAARGAPRADARAVSRSGPGQPLII